MGFEPLNMAGAPEGNTNSKDGRIWRQAIKRALSKRSKVDSMEAIDALAEKLLEQCDQGNIAALKEIGDRLEGKAAQSLELGNTDGKPFVSEVIRRIVRPGD